MFAVIYRNYIKSNKETEYQQLWHQLANYFISHCGAIDSCLHKTDEGYWLAYSRWPDKATRDAAWPGENSPNKILPEHIQQIIVKLKACGDEEKKLPEITMTVTNDLL